MAATTAGRKRRRIKSLAPVRDHPAGASSYPMNERRGYWSVTRTVRTSSSA
nr:MAG TPA: hypothetical protein [Caudoviricetes sp.]